MPSAGKTNLQCAEVVCPTMNVAFCVNEGYIQHLCVAVASLLANKEKDEAISLYVLSPSFEDQRWYCLQQIISGHSCEIHFQLVEDALFSELPLTKHFHRSVYYRLAVQDLVPCEKFLYLDADLLVLSSIRRLYATNIDGQFLAAVKDPSFRNHTGLGLSSGSEYFNSGMMLINNEMFRQANMKRAVIEFVSTHPSRIKYPDQCGLNRIVDGNWLQLQPEFNVQSKFLDKTLQNKGLFDCFDRGEFQKAVHHPAIVHYTGASKPWHYISTHPYKSLYWEYLKLTPFANAKPEGRNMKNIIRRCAPKFIIDHAERLLSNRKAK